MTLPTFSLPDSQTVSKFIDTISDNLAGAIAVNSSTYGMGIGPIVATDVSCMGTENTLLNCGVNYNTDACSHSEDAGAQCNATCKIFDRHTK